MSKDGSSATTPAAARKSRTARPTVTPGDDAGAAELGRRVADNLRERRRVSHLSLDELAKLSGVSRAALSQIETCKTNPSLSVLWKVASGLKIPFAELIGEAAFRIAPLTDVDAEELVTRGKAGRLVAGFRGAPPADRAALEDLVHRLARLGDREHRHQVVARLHRRIYVCAGPRRRRAAAALPHLLARCDLDAYLPDRGHRVARQFVGARPAVRLLAQSATALRAGARRQSLQRAGPRRARARAAARRGRRRRCAAARRRGIRGRVMRRKRR